MNLREDLHRVADDAALQPIAMAGVRAKARAIHRRRVSTAVGGAVAGVAAVAAVAVLAMPGNGDRTQPLPSTRSASPTTVTSAQAGPVVPVNFTPDVEHTYGGEVLVPNWMNGSLQDQHGNAAAISTPVHHAVVDPSGGGWDGFTFANGSYSWTHWTNQGQVVEEVPAPSDKVAISPDGTRWAVLVGSGSTAAIRSYEPALHVIPLNLPAGEPVQGAGVDAILPNGDIVVDIGVGDVRIINRDGVVEAPLSPQFASAVGAYPDGTVVAQLSHSTPSGVQCYGGVTETGRQTSGSCYRTDTGIRLSANGQLIFRALTNHDGTVTAAVERSARSTESSTVPSAELLFPKGTAIDADDGAWIGDSFVLPTWWKGEWRLVWLSTDGYKITRSLQEPGSSDASPFLLGAGPLTVTNP